MRYIKKIAIKDLDKHEDIKPLLAYIEAERNPTNPLNPSRHPNYVDMGSDNRGATQKSLLRQLRKENYHLCSFCQENVGTNNYLIEHLVPQSIFKNEEVDYYNLFLCCGSKGQCSDAKADMLIGKFVTHSKCETFFKYSLFGEILPNSNYASWENCKQNLQNLTPMQLQAYNTIQILNLNKDVLVAKREFLYKTKAYFEGSSNNSLYRILKDKQLSLDELKQEQAKYLPTPDKKVLPEFANMFLYFINEQIEKRFGRNNI